VSTREALARSVRCDGVLDPIVKRQQMNIEELLPLVPRIDPTAASVESRGRWWTWGEVATLTDAVARALMRQVPRGRSDRSAVAQSSPATRGTDCVRGIGRCAVAFNPVPPPQIGRGRANSSAELLVAHRKISMAGIREVAAGRHSGALLPDDQ